MTEPEEQEKTEELDDDGTFEGWHVERVDGELFWFDKQGRQRFPAFENL